MNNLIYKIQKTGGIITGSIALKMVNMLPESRESGDIDLIFSTLQEFELFATRMQLVFGSKNSELYEDNYFFYDLDGVKIDAFIANRQFRTYTVMGFKVHHWTEILAAKTIILSDRLQLKDDVYKKHLADFNYIFNGVHYE